MTWVYLLVSSPAIAKNPGAVRLGEPSVVSHRGADEHFGVPEGTIQHRLSQDAAVPACFELERRRVAPLQQQFPRPTAADFTLIASSGKQVGATVESRDIVKESIEARPATSFYNAGDCKTTGCTALAADGSCLQTGCVEFHERGGRLRTPQTLTLHRIVDRVCFDTAPESGSGFQVKTASAAGGYKFGWTTK